MDIDLLLIRVNALYLIVYITMIIEIIFFFVFIKALDKAIKEEALNSSETNKLFNTRYKIAV